MKNPVAVDLFSGAGGLAEGLAAAGFHVPAAVELHPQAALTHAFNHPGTQLLVGDIRALDMPILDKAIASTADPGTVDLVAGGPPCQGFSSAGKKEFRDPRNSLFRPFVEVVRHLRPRMFLLENVPGFKTRYEGRVYQEAVDAFQDLGYAHKSRIVHAMDYGVPQTRKRFMMVGWIPGEVDGFEWPAPSHGDTSEDQLFDEVHPYVTAEDALDDLAFVAPGFEATRYSRSKRISGFARHRRSSASPLVFNHLATRHRAKVRGMYELIPEGGTIRDVPPEHRSKKLTLSRIQRGAVSNTVVSLPDDMIHYAHDRILTVRENARLQTFDDDYVFWGKRTSGFEERRVDVPQYTQVGNAVPPLLAAAVGRALLKSLGTSQDAEDTRHKEIRAQRHAWVRGSSGYAGYELDPAAAAELELWTVRGNRIELPVTKSAPTVRRQVALREWVAEPKPRTSQWAPELD